MSPRRVSTNETTTTVSATNASVAPKSFLPPSLFVCFCDKNAPDTVVNSTLGLGGQSSGRNSCTSETMHPSVADRKSLLQFSPMFQRASCTALGKETEVILKLCVPGFWFLKVRWNLVFVAWDLTILSLKSFCKALVFHNISRISAPQWMLLCCVGDFNFQ